MPDRGELRLSDQLRFWADREETPNGLVLAHRDDLIEAAELLDKLIAKTTVVQRPFNSPAWWEEGD